MADNIPTPKPDPRGYYPVMSNSDGSPVYSDAKALKRDDIPEAKVHRESHSEMENADKK